MFARLKFQVDICIQYMNVFCIDPVGGHRAGLV